MARRAARMKEAPTTLKPADLPIEDQSCISGDLHCLGCGYNLRTLRRGDTYPECALPVNHSTQRNLLRFADPAWVFRRVADEARTTRPSDVGLAK